MYIASSQPHFDDVMRQLKELKELAGTPLVVVGVKLMREIPFTQFRQSKGGWKRG